MKHQTDKEDKLEAQKGSALAWTLVVVLLILLLVTEGALFYLLGRHNYLEIFNKSETVTTSISPTPTLTPTTSTPDKRPINREYSFPITEADGTTAGKMNYVLKDYEITTEITVKGQRATAVTGRAFLIVNVEITNEYDKTIEVDARDYLRLSVNNEERWSAPDIHEDPVEIQASSTKITRIGFPINESDINLRLEVGELEGKKDLILLD